MRLANKYAKEKGMEPSVFPHDAIVVAVAGGWAYYLTPDGKIHTLKQ